MVFKRQQFYLHIHYIIKETAQKPRNPQQFQMNSTYLFSPPYQKFKILIAFAMLTFQTTLVSGNATKLQQAIPNVKSVKPLKILSATVTQQIKRHFSAKVTIRRIVVIQMSLEILQCTQFVQEFKVYIILTLQVFLLFLLLECFRYLSFYLHQTLYSKIQISLKRYAPWTFIIKSIRFWPLYIDKSQDCSICLNSDCNIRTKCGHLFHSDCLKLWAKKQLKCLLCKNIEINPIVLYCTKCFKQSKLAIMLGRMKVKQEQLWNRSQHYKCQIC